MLTTIIKWIATKIIIEADLLEAECKKFNMNFVGLTETKWKGPGGHYYTQEGNLIMHSKADRREHGVGAFVDKGTAKKVIGGINERIIIVRLAASPHNVTIFIVYAPTSTHLEDEMETFYEQMTEALEKYRKDICFIIGDFNAKVRTEKNEVTGCFGLGERNERGNRLVQFCRDQGFGIANTMFQHHKRRLVIWTSPRGDMNQIDYILVQQRWKSMVRNAKTHPGAMLDTYHNLL